MRDLTTYQIHLLGQIDVKELNPISPLEMRLVQIERSATILAIRSDQSGLIGLLRHLHGLGFVILALTACREEEEK